MPHPSGRCLVGDRIIFALTRTDRKDNGSFGPACYVAVRNSGAIEGQADPLRTSSIRRVCRVGPGNFTPSPSQIPDLNLSIHPARVTARRLPPSVVYRALPAVGYPTIS